MDEQAIASLQELGLGLYEARLYLGLLTNGPQNGNELSRLARVPSSKTYATLDKLVAAGIVQRRRKGRSAEYEPVPPDELVRLFKAKYGRPLEYLEKTLPHLTAEDDGSEILRMIGEKTVLEHARDLIAEAERDLYISAWDTHIDELEAALVDADRAGVRIFAMIYGDAELPMGFWLHHSYRETVSSRIGGHMLTIVGDGNRALLAHFPDNDEASGVVTHNPVLCLVAEEYLRHDLLLQKAKTMTGYDKWDDWLHADSDVRDITLGRSGRESPIDDDDKRRAVTESLPR